MLEWIFRVVEKWNWISQNFCNLHKYISLGQWGVSCSLCVKATERSKAANGCQVSLLFPPWLPRSQPTAVVPSAILSCVPLIHPLSLGLLQGLQLILQASTNYSHKWNFGEGKKKIGLGYNGTLAAFWYFANASVQVFLLSKLSSNIMGENTCFILILRISYSLPRWQDRVYLTQFV